MFSRLWDGLCNGTVTSSIGIARVLIAAGVFMLLQLAIGIDLCCCEFFKFFARCAHPSTR